MCGGRSGTLWLPLHHPGGCCTLVVVEEIPPLYVKRFECLEKRYINVTNYYYYFNLGRSFSAVRPKMGVQVNRLITYKALNGLAPQYLSELLSHYSPSRPLHSQNSGHLIIPRISKLTAGGRSFSYLGPKLWNNLPNTVREADTLCQF